MFEVKGTLRFFIRDPSQYQQKPRSKNVSHVRIVEQADHFWREGSSFWDATDKVD